MTAERDPDTIAKELDQHRDDLARTLDELTVKVSPKRLVAKGKYAVLQTTKGRAVLAGAGGLIATVVAVKVGVKVRRRRHRHPLRPHKH